MKTTQKRMKYFYKKVPDFREVAISRYAQRQAAKESVTDDEVYNALWHGKKSRVKGDKKAVHIREYGDVRLEVVDLRQTKTRVHYSGYLYIVSTIRRTRTYNLWDHLR